MVLLASASSFLVVPESLVVVGLTLAGVGALTDGLALAWVLGGSGRLGVLTLGLLLFLGMASID